MKNLSVLILGLIMSVCVCLYGWREWSSAQTLRMDAQTKVKKLLTASRRLVISRKNVNDSGVYHSQEEIKSLENLIKSLSSNQKFSISNPRLENPKSTRKSSKGKAKESFLRFNLTSATTEDVVQIVHQIETSGKFIRLEKLNFSQLQTRVRREVKERERWNFELKFRFYVL